MIVVDVHVYAHIWYVYGVYIGVFIIRDQFSIGKSATASCKSDAPATRIEWLRDGVVVESATFTGIQELDLVFSPVNDSIHNQVYVCRVMRVREDGMTVTAMQNFTVNVDGKMMILTVRRVNNSWLINSYIHISVPLAP